MDNDAAQSSKSKPAKQFGSSFGVIFSCLGCVIGTGNIWRFPRILAKHSGEAGAGAFLIIWFISLLTWSIPLLVVEYSIGRFTRIPPVRVFVRYFGKIGFTLGSWINFVMFFIGSYYSVILGWCLYYIYFPIQYYLPKDEEESVLIFNGFVQSNWSLIPFSLSILLVAGSVIGGIKAIEKVNAILVPVLLIILLGLFFYASTLTYSEYGFSFLFTGDWGSLLNPSLYLDAISQTAFDTGAGNGLIAAYAIYMAKESSVVRYSVFIPMVNNAVSLLAAMTILPTVFGILLLNNPTMTQSGIVSIVKGGGLAGTGLTFIWMPILMETLGPFGRFLCSSFFICLSFAGISSLISVMELQTISLMQFGISRKLSVIVISFGMFLFGTVSVLNLNFLVNQDNVWGFSLIISGLIFIALVYLYGPEKFRNELVNKNRFARDFSLPFVWVILITVVAPIEALALIVWWIYSDIKDNPTGWYKPDWTSLITTWIEWVLLAIFLISLNILFVKLQIPWIVKEGTISPKPNENFLRNPIEIVNQGFDDDDQEMASTAL